LIWRRNIEFVHFYNLGFFSSAVKVLMKEVGQVSSRTAHDPTSIHYCLCLPVCLYSHSLLKYGELARQACSLVQKIRRIGGFEVIFLHGSNPALCSKTIKNSNARSFYEGLGCRLAVTMKNCNIFQPMCLI